MVVRVAVGQTNPQINNRDLNLQRLASLTREAAMSSARLIVFPECALTGYCYTSKEEALAQAEVIPGPSSETLIDVAQETGTFIVFGLIERTSNSLFNSAALIGPEGIVGVYRKTHLPLEGVDRFVAPGPGPFEVHETPIGRIGVLICYDMRFPEPARILALQGAEIIVHPTNLPPEGSPQPDFIYHARAAENRVWIVSADRVGTERGVRFIGRSAIVDPTGKSVANGDEHSEELILADIEPAMARLKDLVIVPDQYELHTFADRRPDLYSSLAAGLRN
jgi:predicted amidohydrolase